MGYCIIHRDDEKSIEISTKLKSMILEPYDEISPQYVIAVGGDGTIIKAAHSHPTAILFGVHTGHLGFYANYTADDLESFADDFNQKKYKIEAMDVLSCKIQSKSGCFESIALNEVTVVTPARTLILDVSIDSEHFERYRGTGICISTPSGSTAYNKSLHGSVIDPNLKCMQMTEIAGINSNAYRTLSSPLVLSYDRKIHLSAIKSQEVFVTVDHLSFTVCDFEKLEVYYENKQIQMAYTCHESFIKRINRTFLISKE